MKPKTVFYTITVLILLAGAGFALWQGGYIGNRQATQDVTEDFKPKASGTKQTLPPTDDEIKIPKPQSSAKLTIDNLATGDVIKAGDTVSGKVQSAEGVLYITIRGNATGKVADYSIIVTKSDKEPQAYSFEVVFEKPPQSNEKAILDIYTKQGGIRAHSAQLEVRLQ